MMDDHDSLNLILDLAAVERAAYREVARSPLARGHLDGAVDRHKQALNAMHEAIFSLLAERERG